MNPEYSSSRFGAAITIQMRVVGALIIREMHTRFGRHNVGFLWMILEPMTLALGITIAHLFGFNVSLPYGIDQAAFWITGYTPWVMFRSIVLRASAAIESNRTLLYHRIVTIFDIHLARALLDGGAVTFCLLLLVSGLWVLGICPLPQRPLYLFFGMGLLWWLAFGFSLLYSAWAEISHLAEKIVEPTTYLVLPISGVFFLVSWLPPSIRHAALWVPMPNIIEFIRQGEFGSLNSPDISIPYVLCWCLGSTIFGLLAVRAVRKRVEL